MTIQQIESWSSVRVGRELLGTPLITLLRHGHAPGAAFAQIVEAARGDVSVPEEITSVFSRKFRFVISISNKCYRNEDGDVSFQVHTGWKHLLKGSYNARCITTGLALQVALGQPALPAILLFSTDQTSGLPLKPVSPDLTAYESLSPEDRPTIALHHTPSVTKPLFGTPSTVVQHTVRCNLFSAKSAASVEKESLRVEEDLPGTDAEDVANRSELPLPEAVTAPQDNELPEVVFTPQDKKKSKVIAAEGASPPLPKKNKK